MPDVDDPRDTGQPDNDPNNRPPFRAIVIALTVVTLLLLVYALWSDAKASGPTVFAVELLVGLVALVGGSLLGFLFGIPRTPQRVGGTNATSSSSERAVYEPSNNLEQVSDWLTKVLLGATLVQLKELRESLSTLGLRVMQGIGGSATSIVTQLTLVGCAILGFLAGFMWTRVYYGAIQVRADNTAFGLLSQKVEQVKHQVEETKKEVEDAKQQVEDAKQQSVEVATKSDQARLQAEQAAATAGRLLQSAASTDVMAALSPGQIAIAPALAEKITRFNEAPAVWDSNPVLDIFGSGTSSADGLTLSATIDTVSEQSLILTLKVTGDGTPLPSQVVFLLHPTLLKPVHAVTPRNDVASVTLYTEGWFHAAAIAGNTILILDLRTVPGVPDWFKDA